MPNLLRKKKRSSSASTIVIEEEEDRQASEPPPSPSSSRTAVSARSPIAFVPISLEKKSSASSLKHGGHASSSSSSLKAKLSPMKTMVAQKVKRQIQRLDEALSHVTATKPAGSLRHSGSAISNGDSGSVESTPPKSKSRLFRSTSSIFPSPSLLIPSLSPSPRKRTVSTRDGDGFFRRKPPRNRTISCPTAIDPSPEMSLEASQRVDPSAASLRLVHEETEIKGAESTGSLAPEIVLSVVYVEEEVPDPFLVDEEGDALSSEEESPNPFAPKPLPSALTPNVNKDIPSPPISDSEDEEDVPELYLPGLVIPTMFLPIPNTDPLTILLNKYIFPPESRPMRDVSGDWQHSDFHTLVMTNSWRALARMARDRIVSSDPEDLNLILGLWHLRLSCLARLRLFNQTAAECTNLFSVLNNINPLESKAYLFERILPFELEVVQTRLKYWAGDHMGYLDALTALLRKCKVNARIQGKSDPTTLSMWRERGARVALIMASQMVEMKEFTAASHLLEPLSVQADGAVSPSLSSAIARIYLQGGNLHMAAKHFAQVQADPSVDERQKQINKALLASAQGDWKTASGTLKQMIEKDNEDYVAVNNLSVALLNQGKLKESIEVLETALKASPSSVVVAEPFLFNLSTLYELRSSIGFENKRDLLVEVAKWSGDGLKTACLKLPTN